VVVTAGRRLGKVRGGRAANRVGGEAGDILYARIGGCCTTWAFTVNASMLTDKKPYDANLHARNQQKHGSWVLKLVPRSTRKLVNNFYEEPLYNPENNYRCRASVGTLPPYPPAPPMQAGAR